MRKEQPTTCGGKAKQPDYGPQIAAQTAANTALAERSQDFSENYYNTYVAPLMEQMTAQSKSSTSNENALFAANLDQMNVAKERYTKYGIPAEDAYYKMVQKYSEPEEENRQATAALGDVRTAAGNQRGTLSRQWSALGIDPTSPAALSAMSDSAVMNTAAEAGAANRARAAAKQLGMSLTSDAANFGRGGQSGILQFGAAASGNTQGAFGVANGAVQGSSAGASVPMAGYSQAMKGYSSNLDSLTSLQNQAAQINSQAGSGLGSLVGTLGSAAISHFSDRRLKKNILHVAYLPNGLDLYTFEYTDPDYGPGTHMGYMADEVQALYPEAVSSSPDGFLMVNYAKVPR